MRLSAQSGEGLGVVGVDGRRSVGSGATSVVASLATETTSLSSASTGSLTRSLTTLSVSSGRSGRLGELTVNLDVNLLLLGLALGLGVLRLAGEEVVNGLPDESLTLNLGGNFSSLLLAESGDGSVLLSTLGKILLVRLGRFLGLLLSLGLSGGSLGLSHDTLSRSLRSVLLNLCVLLTLNLVLQLSLTRVGTPTVLNLLLAVGGTVRVPPLELPPLTGLSRDLGTPVVAVTGRSVATGNLSGPAASGALGVSVAGVVALLGSGNSLAVESTSGLGALVVGNSVVTGDGVGASVVVASTSVGVTTGSSTRDSSLSGGGLRLLGSGFSGGRSVRLVVWKLRQVSLTPT